MRRITLIMLAVLTMAVLTACGSSEEAGPPPATFDFAFTSALMFEPASLTVQEGQTVTINLDNSESALEHSWVLVPAGTDLTLSAEQLSAQAILGADSGTIAPGESGSLTFVAPAAGSYQYVCTVAGHITGGMVGDFTVSAGG